MISGFGTERLGRLAIRFPVIATFMLVIVTVFAAMGIPELQYSGDNIEVLRDGSIEFENHDHLLNTFRNFNNDAIVLVTSDRLDTLEGFEAFRELHFDLQFSPLVESLLSPFSLVSHDAIEEGWQFTIPAEFETEEDLKKFLKKMNEANPAFQSLFAPDRKSAVIIIYARADALADANIRETLDHYRTILRNYEKDGLKATMAGQPAIRADLMQGVANDMKRLAPMAVIFCMVIAFFIFRNLISTFFCVFPPILSVIWLVGILGHLSIHFNFLTIVLPVLLIVVVFADALHFYMKWDQMRTRGTDSDGITSIANALSTAGPACSLAMITTACALSSLVLSGNSGLSELGIVGAMAMVGGFIAIIVALPLSLYWANRLDLNIHPSRADRLAVIARAAELPLRYSRLTIVFGFIICALGLMVHFNLDSRFRLIDYLATSSSVARSESHIDQRFSGTTPLFAIIRLDQSVALLDKKNRSIFYRAKAAIDKVFPSATSYSIDDFIQETNKRGGRISESDIDKFPENIISRFVSRDRSEVLVTIFSSASHTAREMANRLDELKILLMQEKLDKDVIITGFPILSSVVAPRLMDNLRVSLLAAIFLSIFIIMLAARSIRFALACLIPNLLPVLSMEIIFWMFGIPLDISVTVALTVALGIAIGDSIHLLNQYMIEMGKTNNVRVAVKKALRETSPAIFSTTLFLVAGLSVTLLSELPIIIFFSTVIILTLIFALASDIFQTPSCLIAIGGTIKKDRRSVCDKTI